jgi:hypothetical protein
MRFLVGYLSFRSIAGPYSLKQVEDAKTMDVVMRLLERTKLMMGSYRTHEDLR